MTEQEHYYLSSILRNLLEFRTAVSVDFAPTIGTEVLSDNINWLECFIERGSKGLDKR
jgi:hypothetical protein